MHKCLSTERSSINVEAEPRTYCCGGRVAALEGAVGNKIFGCWGGKKNFERWQGKIFWGTGWPNIFRGGMVERFLGWGTKNLGGSMAKYFGDGVTIFWSGKKIWMLQKMFAGDKNVFWGFIFFKFLTRWLVSHATRVTKVNF